MLQATQPVAPYAVSITQPRLRQFSTQPASNTFVGLAHFKIRRLLSHRASLHPECAPHTKFHKFEILLLQLHYHLPSPIFTESNTGNFRQHRIRSPVVLTQQTNHLTSLWSKCKELQSNRCILHYISFMWRANERSHPSCPVQQSCRPIDLRFFSQSPGQLVFGVCTYSGLISLPQRGLSNDHAQTRS